VELSHINHIRLTHIKTIVIRYTIFSCFRSNR